MDFNCERVGLSFVHDHETMVFASFFLLPCAKNKTIQLRSAFEHRPQVAHVASEVCAGQTTVLVPFGETLGGVLSLAITQTAGIPRRIASSASDKFSHDLLIVKPIELLSKSAP